MAERVTTDCSTGETTRVALTPAEVSSLADVAVAVAKIDVRRTDADDALTQLIAQAGGSANVRTKLKAALVDPTTISDATVKRLVLALALWALRDRADS